MQTVFDRCFTSKNMHTLSFPFDIKWSKKNWRQNNTDIRITLHLFYRRSIMIRITNLIQSCLFSQRVIFYLLISYWIKLVSVIYYWLIPHYLYLSQSLRKKPLSKFEHLLKSARLHVLVLLPFVLFPGEKGEAKIRNPISDWYKNIWYMYFFN